MPNTDDIQSFQELRQEFYDLQSRVERIQQRISRPTRPIYIPVTQFSGFLSDSFLGTGTPNLENINSLGIVGARIEAVGDACHHLWSVPKDFNVNSNIKFEPVWTTNSIDTAETATWTVEHSPIADGETLIAPATALNEPGGADNVLGAYALAVAPYGLLHGDVLQHGDLVHLKLSLSAVSGLNPAVDLVYLLGILINDQ